MLIHNNTAYTIDPLGLWGDTAYDPAFLVVMQDPTGFIPKLDELAVMLDEDVQRLRWWAGVFVTNHVLKEGSAMQQRYAPLVADGSIAKLLG